MTTQVKHNNSTSSFSRFWSKFFGDPVDQLVDDHKLAAEIRGQQILAIKETTPMMLLANTVCLLASVFVLNGIAENSLLLIWSGVLASIILLGAKGIKFRPTSQPRILPRNNTHQVVVNSFFLALGWAALPILFFADANEYQKIFITAVASGLMGGGSMALAVTPIAAGVFCWTIGLGAFFALLIQFNPINCATAVLLLTYSISLLGVSASKGQDFVKRILVARKVEEQGETIELLLKDFENSASDWMWETDADGLIVTPSNRFCESTGQSYLDLNRLPFKSLISVGQNKGSCEITKIPLGKRLETAVSFKDHEIQIDSALGRRWWRMTGKPLFNNTGAFSGFRGSASDVHEAKNNQNLLSDLAHYDQVTGLPNSGHFREIVEEALNAVRRTRGISGSRLALIHIDVDRLGSINETLDYGTTDALLKEVANRIEATVSNGDQIGRMRGADFVVLHWLQSNQQDESDLAKKLLDQLSRPFLINNYTINVGTSIGLALDENSNQEMDLLFRNADLALNIAKQSTDNQLVSYQPGMGADLARHRNLEVELRNALHEEQFVLHYQAMVDLRTGEKNTYEALLRWNHPTRGLLYPESLTELAENSGMIAEIGDWMLTKACEDAASWNEKKSVAIHVSSKQIGSRDFDRRLESILRKSGLGANRLEVELTESTLTECPEKVEVLFSKLRNSGLKITLDNFGVGYSSLSNLARFQLDKLKIDNSFIRHAGDSKGDLAILKSIIGLGKNLGIDVIADGIQNRAQLDLAAAEGCHQVQGDFMEPTAPGSGIEDLLADSLSNKSRSAA